MDSFGVDNSYQGIHKIVITGPESTGKSTLTEQLAKHYELKPVLEYAREYIDHLQRPYEQSDLWEIAKGQILLEQRVLNLGQPFLFCDSDLITIYIWSKFKYGTVDGRIIDLIHQRHYDQYLLCGIDLPWEYDPQRENPNQRLELYELYKATLEEFNKPYIEIWGTESERLAKAIETINSLQSRSES